MDDRKLIELVRNCPCLYDKSNTDFKNREEKRRAWMEVASSLEVDETTIIKRWGNLRERFSKEIRSTRNSSGSGASMGRQWALLVNLKFLKRHIIPRPMRQSTSILECSVEHAINGEILNVSTESPSLSPIPPAQLSAVSPAQSTPIPPAPPITRPSKRRAAQLEELDTSILWGDKRFWDDYMLCNFENE